MVEPHGAGSDLAMFLRLAAVAACVGGILLTTAQAFFRPIKHPSFSGGIKIFYIFTV
jgi:hypothetical protein